MEKWCNITSVDLGDVVMTNDNATFVLGATNFLTTLLKFTFNQWSGLGNA
jgi:hypothetical protein